MTRKLNIPKRNLVAIDKQSIKLVELNNLVKKGLALHQQGNLNQAQEIYLEVLQQEPDHFDALQLIGALSNQVMQFHQAVQYHSRALKINASHAVIHYNYGNALLGLGQMEDAIASYNQAIALKPDYAEAYSNQGNALLALGQLEDAIASYNQAIALKPNYAEVYFNRGNALFSFKRMDEAIASYCQAIALNPNYIEAYFCQGNVLMSCGRLGEAIARYNQAISLKADLPDVYFNRGNALLMVGQLESAITSYNQAIALKPNYIEAYCNLGNALQSLGKLEAAIESYNYAITYNPEFSLAYTNRGNALQSLGKLEAAIENYNQAIAIKPDLADAYYNRGNALLVLRYLKPAIESYNQAILLKPNYAEAYCNRGNVLKEMGQFDAAIESYNRATSLKPNYADPYCNRGNVLKETGELEAALESYNQAISIKPDYAEAFYNRGNVLKEMGELDAAIASYDQAIAIKPSYVEAYTNRGNAFQGLKNPRAAIASYDQAIAIKPDYEEPYSNRGNALKEMGQFSTAIENFDQAIRLRPDFAEAHYNRGIALMRDYRYVDALSSIDIALQFNPQLGGALQGRASVLALMSDYTELCALSDRALEMATPDTLHSVWEGRLYHWIYHPDLSAQEICAEHVKWGGRFAGLKQRGFDGHDRTLERPLRVGYVSPDFRGHSCRFYFEPLFAEHSHKNFEFFAYSNVLVEDDHTDRMKSYFDKWTSILGVSDDMAAELIRRDEIDILVDGCGHMMDTRLSVFAHKPAPIQVTWLGAAWTTGLPQMDYVLFDPFMAPEGTATSEKILHLPRTWAAFRPSEKAKQVDITPSPAAINGRVTFGYSGRSERLNYRVFRVWANILNRLPEARLVLDYKAFVDPKTQEYFKGILEINGVDTARLILRNSENIFKGLGDIDILLDSFPHSGGTMLFDAAWMGVPIVTLASDRPVGRIGASLMMNLGLPDWVATDEQEYEDKAVRFAQNIPALASLRSDMRTRMQSSPVMDEKSFARDVESAYQEMWRTWVGTAP